MSDNSLNGTANTKVFTISWTALEGDCAIFTAAFSSRERAEAFMEKMSDKLKIRDGSIYRIDLDSPAIDDEMYLDYINEMESESGE